MKTILQLKNLVIIPLLFLVGNVWGQYKLPFEGGTSVYCTQGNSNNSSSHNGISQYAFDFKAPFNAHSNTGTKIVAARGGCVRRLMNVGQAGHDESYKSKAKFVVISHGDGTEAVYWHLASVLVTLGQEIQQGQEIGIMGNTGWTTCGSCAPNGQFPDGTHLHFHVQNYSQSCPNVNASGYTQSIPISFDDVSGNGIPTGSSSSSTSYISGNYSDPIPNQSLSIYGGTVANPKEINVYFKATDFNTTVSASSSFTVPFFNIKNPVTNALITVPSNYISQLPSTTVGTIVWRHFKVDLSYVANNSNLPTNGYACDIGFDVVVGSITKHFHGDSQLYFLDPSTLTDIGTLDDKWYDKYVKDGVNYGLFRGGSPSSTTSSVSFNPSGLLTKPQAAAVVVTAGVKLGILNIDTSGTPYADIPPSNPYFKYVQTLKNAGITGTPSNNEFGVNENITQDRFCKWVAMACNITAADINQFQYINTAVNINYTSTDATLQPYVNIMTKTPSIRNGLTLDSVQFIEPLYSPFDYSTVTTSTMPTSYACNKNVTRDIMAKVMTLAYEFKKPTSPNAQGRSANNTNSIPSDFIAYGEKYDNASITATSTPITPSQQTYSCASGGSITILYNPGSLPQHYYWSMLKNGATLTSNNTQHSSVTFTAPTVSSPTQWKLYTYTANNKGKARETFITINVGGSSSGSNSFPTQQAYNIQVTANNNQTNYIGLSWIRGNGQNCIVTATPLPNSESLPQDGQTYSHNQNIQLAGSIGNTKVVYQGTSNTANIVNLTQNIDYKFTVYEYNGTNYNVTNAPSITARLEPLPPYTTSISYTPSTIVTGQSVTFCVNSENNCNTVWSNSGGSATNNGTSCQNVIFSTAGTYTVSVVATECGTNVTDNDTVTVTVYNPNQLEPDFIVQNLTSNKTATSVGQNVTVNYSVTNTGLVNGYLTDVSYYISNDNSLSVDDILVLNDPYNTPYQINSNNSVTLSKTFSIPNSVSLGNKFIIVKADGQNAETETNENNNTASIGLNIVNALPDLIITSANLPNGSIYASGVTIPINLTVGNLGTSSSNLECFFDVFLSPNGNISNPNNWNEAVLYTGTGNYPQNLTINPIFLSSLPNGTYTIFVVVDQANNNNVNNLIAELNETNNTYTVGTITISNPNQPTVQVTNASITNKTSNSATLNWTNGNGTGRLILAREEQAVYKDPLDANNYAANSDFSSALIYESARVVYNGNGNSTTITGLTAGKTYFFNIYEYKITGSNADYLQLKPETIITHLDNLNNANWVQNSSEYVGFGNLSIVNNQLKVLCIGSGEGKMIQSNNNGYYFNETKYNTGKSFELGSVSQSEMQFLSENLGYALRVTKIVKTTDGGLNWNNQTIDLFGNKSLTGVYFIDSNNGFICSRGIGTDTSGVIYKTTDGGNNWNSIYFGSNRLYDIKFLNSQIGYCVGENGTILFTNNGGTSWQSKSIPLGSFTTLSIRDIALFDSNNIIVVGFSNSKGVIYKSTNSGNSWINVLSTTEYYQFRQIVFKNSNIGYATPKYSNTVSANYLYKTFDGGLSWNQFIIPTSDLPSDIILNNNELWLTTKQSGTGAIHSIYKYTEPIQPNAISLNLSTTSICTSENLLLNYNIQGVFANNNVFNIQLSDSNGSFSNPTLLSTFTNSGSGSLQNSIPSSLITGNYKLRIVSTNPSLISNETQSFLINQEIQPVVNLNPSATTICPNTNVTFTATSTNGGTSPIYLWKRNGQVVGTNNNQYSASDITNNDVVWVEMVSNQTCTSTIPVISLPVSVNVTQIDEAFIQAIDNILAASTDIGVQWIRNGQPIAGATSQFYEATQTGFYQFSVTVNGCTVLSDIYQLTTLGTNTNEFDNNSLKVFPNPFNDLLNIEVKEDSFQSFQIIDLQGRLIVQEKISGNSHQINLSSLPQSVYILEIITDKGKKRVKIVKK